MQHLEFINNWQLFDKYMSKMMTLRDMSGTLTLYARSKEVIEYLIVEGLLQEVESYNYTSVVSHFDSKYAYDIVRAYIMLNCLSAESRQRLSGMKKKARYELLEECFKTVSKDAYSLEVTKAFSALIA